MKSTLVRAALLAAVAVHPGCNQAILTAPAGSTIQVFVNPTFIAANGDVAVISALLLEPAGTPVADGTVVQFFTSLGRIEEQGRTNDGVARVNLVSDSRSGTATITAVSGGDATAGVTAEVVIGSARPARVLLVPDRPRITNPRYVGVVATVFDADGNPVANVPVVFIVEQLGSGDATERMQSGGVPIFTDNNGQARDEVLTEYDPGDPVKTVEVSAIPAGDDENAGTTQIQIN
jgi:hypothetical protein